MPESNTFVLQEVIDDLVKSQNTLVDPLTKLNYFGMLIKNNELTNYTSNELNGYRKIEDVPAYRKTPATLMVVMQAHIHIHTKPLPISMLEEPIRTSLKYLLIKEGIGTIERLVRDLERDGSNDSITHSLPMEMLKYFQDAATKLYRTNTKIDVVGARIVGSQYIMIEIINAVRTKLLALAMKVGEDFGFSIEIATFRKNEQINNQTINNIMKTEITNTGDGNVVNSGANSNVTATITITKGDEEKLNKTLAEFGIDIEDIEELNTIIATELPDYENKKLGPETNSWIGKIVVKTLNGIGKIASGATGNILATLIKGYYGIDN